MTKPLLRQSIGRIMVAIAAATLAACAVAFLAGFIFVAATWDGGPGYWSIAVAIAGATAYFTFLACPVLFVLVGLPLYALSLHNQWLTASAYIATGAAVSCLFAIAAWFAFSFDRYLATPLIFVGGTAATYAFWMVARPDRAQVR